MVAYLPGPYVIDFEYQVTISTQVLTHHITANCVAVGSPVPGTPSTTVLMQTRSGSTIALSTAVQNFWTVARQAFNTGTTSLVGVTLNRVEPETEIETFISAAVATPATGSSVASAQAGHQTVLTLRSGNGGYLKVNFLEDVESRRDSIALVSNAAGLWYQRVAAYLLSSEGWFSARDRSWPVATMKASFSNNEALEKRRFRPN